ncbi:hypothetical protein Tsp_09800, partial [Trichinella spiralis]|uniref:hypothetical protein n=1 Tax=Trichinella spiralis TaxID=6334 RepID=UPI0001EFD7E2
ITSVGGTLRFSLEIITGFICTIILFNGGSLLTATIFLHAICCALRPQRYSPLGTLEQNRSGSDLKQPISFNT